MQFPEIKKPFLKENNNINITKQELDPVEVKLSFLENIPVKQQAERFLEIVKEYCKPDPCVLPEKETHIRYKLRHYEEKIRNELKDFDKLIKEMNLKAIDPFSKKGLEMGYRSYIRFISSPTETFNTKVYMENILRKLENRWELVIKKKYEIKRELVAIHGRLKQLKGFKEINKKEKAVPEEFIEAEETALIQYRRNLLDAYDNKQSNQNQEEVNNEK